MGTADEVDGRHQRAQVGLVFAAAFPVGVFLLEKELQVPCFLIYNVAHTLCLLGGKKVKFLPCVRAVQAIIAQWMDISSSCIMVTFFPCQKG